MIVQCRKCGKETEVQEITADTACPACGAVYAKVNAALRQAELAKASQEKAAAAKAAAEEAKAEKAKMAVYQRHVAENLRKWLCLACGTFMDPKKRAKGSFGLELTLWIVGLLACASIIFIHFGGIILIFAFVYSLYRVFSGRNHTCSSCGSAQIIPATSPKGREELKRRGLPA